MKPSDRTFFQLALNFYAHRASHPELCGDPADPEHQILAAAAAAAAAAPLRPVAARLCRPYLLLTPPVCAVVQNQSISILPGALLALAQLKVS